MGKAYFGINAVAAVRGGCQRLGRGTPHRPRGCGRGRGRCRTAAKQQVVPPQADVGVAAGGGVDLLGIDGATGGRRRRETGSCK